MVEMQDDTLAYYTKLPDYLIFISFAQWITLQKVSGYPWHQQLQGQLITMPWTMHVIRNCECLFDTMVSGDKSNPSLNKIIQLKETSLVIE